MEMKTEDYIKQISKIQHSLCALLANVLFQKALPEFSVVNWEEVFWESKMQAVAIPAFLHSEQLPIEPELQRVIQKEVQSYIAQSIQNYMHHTYIHKLMQKHQIPYCVLKGVASAWYYPEPLIRQMGDVDFLIFSRDIKRVNEILRNEGFEVSKEKHSHHVVVQKDGMCLEMHFEPVGIPDGEVGGYVREKMKDLWSNTKTVQDAPFEFVIPGSVEHAIILLLHMQQHLLSEGIGLRHLCDWAVFVHSFAKGEFEVACKGVLEKIGLWSFARTMSHTASIGIGLPWQEWMGKDENLAWAVFLDILNGGNFGAKDSRRLYEGYFISVSGQKGRRERRGYTAIKSMNRIVYHNWKGARRCKLLLPVGWGYFVVRRLWRILRGRREWFNPALAYQESAKRKELYSKFKLFEIEK